MATKGMRSRMEEIAITGELFLCHLKTAHESYNRGGGSIVDVFPELMIGTAVWVNSIRNPGEWMSVNKIAHVTGIARSTVQHRVRKLTSAGAITKHGHGFGPNENYVSANVSLELQDRLAREIMKAADALRAMRRRGWEGSP